MTVMHIAIAGRVQGVGFRWFVRVAGRRLDLAGWVRNREDGTVEVAASGSAEKLDELRRHVSRGPAGAEVDEVIELESISGELEYPFAMRR